MTDEPTTPSAAPVASWLEQVLPPHPPVAPATPEPVAPAWPERTAAGPGERLTCAALEVVLVVAGLGVGWLIWWVALWHRGSSPARSILHLDLVTTPDGAPPGWRRTAGRELLAKLLVVLAPISALVWLSGHRGLWDRAVGTIVVREVVPAMEAEADAAAVPEPAQSTSVGGW